MNQRTGVDHRGMHGDALADPARGRRDHTRLVGVALFTALFLVSAGSVFVAAGSTRSWFPKRWDPRVAPVAAEVARLRGLAFEHAVQIRYLAPKAFEKQLDGDGSVSSDETKELSREESVLRALGLIGGKVDLHGAVSTSQKSSTLAYYDPQSQEIFVRGTKLDVAHRVTIAHELTHVLQDQHFDLRKLQKRAVDSKSGDASALKALVEGDAVRIQEDYVKKLSAADRMAYEREDDAEGARVGKETASVPDIVQLLSAAPYEFGPSTIRVLLSSGGNAEVDDALTGPTPSSGVFLAPGDISPPDPVDEPPIPADGVALGSAEAFGPFETYLTLAMRLAPERALMAADAVSGGRAVTFRSSRGATCYRVAVSPTFNRSRSSLLGAVREWARARPRTSVDAAGDLVGFTACDPGRSAPVPSSERLRTAVELLGLRAGLTVEVAKGNVSGAFARCVARVFLESPGAAMLVLSIGDRTPTAEQNAKLQPIVIASAVACRANPDSGLS